MESILPADCIIFCYFSLETMSHIALTDPSKKGKNKVSLEIKTERSPDATSERTIGDLVAFMEAMKKQPITNKHYANPNALKEDLEALEKMG